MRTHPHPRVPASRESVSPQFCRTSNRRSLIASHRRIVQPDYQRAKSFFRAEIIRKFLGGCSPESFLRAHDKKFHRQAPPAELSMEGTVHSDARAVSRHFALLERAYLHSKISPKGSEPEITSNLTGTTPGPIDSIAFAAAIERSIIGCQRTARDP